MIQPLPSPHLKKGRSVSSAAKIRVEDPTPGSADSVISIKKRAPSAKTSPAVACCYGFGAPLHNGETDAPGYVDPGTYELKRHRQLRTVLCGRCRLLSHGHMVTVVGGHGGYAGGKQFVTAEELREKLSHLRHEKRSDSCYFCLPVGCDQDEVSCPWATCTWGRSLNVRLQVPIPHFPNQKDAPFIPFAKHLLLQTQVLMGDSQFLGGMQMSAFLNWTCSSSHHRKN